MNDRYISRRNMLIGAAALAQGSRPVCPTSAVNESDTAFLVGLSGVIGVVSSASSLNIRRGPASWYELVKWLPDGASLSVTGTSSDWFKVRASGVTGWVNSWYVILQGTRSVALTRVNTSVKHVALTFDCGSEFGYTNQIQATLKKHGVQASLGLTGDWLNAHSDYAVSIVSAGHQPLNHTLIHRSFTGLSTPGMGPRSPAKRLSRIQANETLMRKSTGIAA